MLGYSREELLQRSIADIEADETPEQTAAHIDQIREHGHVRFEARHRRKDGAIIHVDTSVVHIPSLGERYFAFVRDITARKQLEVQVYQLAFFDPLTALPNRRLLDDRLGQALAASKRSGLHGAVMFLDLDNFKSLNDAHGHGVGDMLLVEVAKRLSDCVRETDTVARLGGDEFVVLLNELDMDHAQSIAQASAVAEKIRTALVVPYELTATPADRPAYPVAHLCSASIGVALFVNHDASPTELLKWADAAMYQAKDAGRNTVRFHEQPMQADRSGA
jgi:diguanylate cyclase (GGDEF)-like protein